MIADSDSDYEDEVEDEDIFIERSLKENRTNRANNEAMTMKKFVATYRKEPLLMFSTVPKRLM